MGGIGWAEMEKEIQKIVKNVMTEVEVNAQTLENTTGIESFLQEQDIKEYVKIAIQEARKNKQIIHSLSFLIIGTLFLPLNSSNSI